MIKATLNTPSGLSVNIEIPESAKEIPFSKYVSANIEYVSICERFDEQKTNYTGAQLNDIVRFLSFVLDIDAKILLGFKVGKLNDIAAKMAGGLDAKGTWEEVDVTLYMLFDYISNIFAVDDYASKKISTFELNGKKYNVPEYFRTALTTGSSELKAWQGLECAEAYRHINQYVTSIKDKLGDEDIYVSKLSDDEKDQLAQITYNGYMRVLACLAQEEGTTLANIIMSGGADVSDYIERKANELNQIDADTALTVFFFGLNIGEALINQLVMNMPLILHNQQRQ
jgi:hypothetical protein